MKAEDHTTALRDSTVVITGGTGTFGHAATRALLEAGCGQVRIFSRDELKQDEMRRVYADPTIKFYLGDVRDVDSVRQAVKGANFVFHAAALKQVPSCEFFPMQAVMTNVIGTHHVVEAARDLGVERVVCLSTDKAAYPINVMGMTKALSEKVAQAAGRTRLEGDCVVASVRYGNVLHSRGSVVPVFASQILQGGPLTVTDPRMTRFLLALPTAIELVLYALTHARPGDLFIRKAPACTIAQLATALQRMFGVEQGFHTIGMRHGEKLHETLATTDELTRAEDRGDYFRIMMDDRDLNYGKYFTEGNPMQPALEDYTSETTVRLTDDEVETLLLSLPEVRESLDRYASRS